MIWLHRALKMGRSCICVPLLTVLVVGCGTREPDRTRRLFDTIGESASTDGESTPRSGPKAPSELGRFSFGLDSREALLLPTGESVRVPTRIGRGGKLVFAFGLAEAAGGQRAEVTFQIEIEREGSPPRTLFHATSDRREAAWREGWIDLGEFADASVNLTFSSAVAEGQAARIVWSNPRLVYPGRAPGRRNLILISIDTLRADHLNSYGYNTRVTTPKIDELARQGVLFRNAFANAPWTTPSHMSLFTSLYPTAHGLDTPIRLMREKTISVNPAVVTLADALRSSGFSTAAFVSAGAISGKYGFWKGFDRYDETVRINGNDIDRVTQKALRWLRQVGDERFFLFLHTYEVHGPNTHPLPEASLDGAGASEAEKAIEGYDGDVRYTDQVLGEFFAELRKAGLYDNSVILLTSDHGENLYDHAVELRPVGHGFSLNEEILHVPLILVAPGLLPSGGEISDLTQLVDVAPTLLELLDVESKLPVMEGRSLAPLLNGDNSLPDRPVFAEATSYGPERKSVRDRRYKLVLIPDLQPDPYRQFPNQEDWDWSSLERRQLFDLSVDPGERNNLAGSHRQLVARMESHLVEFARANKIIQASLQPGFERPDPELVERLRSLGYLQ